MDTTNVKQEAEKMGVTLVTVSCIWNGIEEKRAAEAKCGAGEGARAITCG
jgi:predicted xylose isomerase-like sugar epimerase